MLQEINYFVSKNINQFMPSFYLNQLDKNDSTENNQQLRVK